MLISPESQKVLESNLWRGSEDEMILWCPFCGDREENNHAHCYLQRSTGYWHCFNCGRGSQNIERLLKGYGHEVSYLDKLSNIDYDQTHVQVLKLVRKDESTSANDLKEFENEAKIVPQEHPAFTYLRKRGVPDNDINRDWRIWDKFPGYVFWFWPPSGQIDFYSGRAYHKLLNPKYRHVAAQVPMLGFNLHRSVICELSSKPLLFLVEGLFDALFAPGPSIPLFSNRMHKALRQEIVDLVNKKNFAVVCALDKTEIEGNLKLAEDLAPSVSEVFVFKMAPHKDFGEKEYINLSPAKVAERLLPYYGHNAGFIKWNLENA